MPRRYGADGTRLWNGKTPEEFTEADAYRFMVETEAVLQRKELMDDPAQPAPASGKEEFYLSKKDDVLLTPEQIAAEERRWLFDGQKSRLCYFEGGHAGKWAGICIGRASHRAIPLCHMGLL